MTDVVGSASAPLRIDIGGTIDIPALSLFHFSSDPITVNFALSQRVSVTIREYRAGTVRIESDLCDPVESTDKTSFIGRYGALFYLCGLFSVDGICLEVRSEGPPRAGLGGSASTLVAAIRILDLIKPLNSSPLSYEDIAMLAYRIESIFLVCGLQDHLAATFGGANIWHWRAAPAHTWFLREQLDHLNLDRLNGSICVAYTGDVRDSTTMTTIWRSGFLAGSDRQVWLDLGEITRRFVLALTDGNLLAAAGLLKQEMRIRRHNWPASSTPKIDQFVTVAEEFGCGAKFAGAGGGGSVWAIGERIDVVKLRRVWSNLAQTLPGSFLLNVELSARGLEAALNS